jgi:thioredoxin-dependent peroxiredoxin
LLEIQTRAPDFVLPDADGVDQSLGALLATGPIVLYFYPADFTPGCTREACDLRDLHGELVKAGLRVVGVSPQSPASHARFRDVHSLPFTLLSDVGKSIIRKYDVDGPLGFGVRRATFLIDREGVIRDALLADLRIRRHAAFARKAAGLR